MFRNRKSSVSRLALVVLILVLSALATPTGARASGTTTAAPEAPPAGSTTCSGCSFIGPYIDPNGGGTRS